MLGEYPGDFPELGLTKTFVQLTCTGPSQNLAS
jgi:hypothetical protein